MAATLRDLKEWFGRGMAEGATHMIVACDTFDWEDYPVFVGKDENVRDRVDEFNGKNMQKVMEVYSYNKTWDEQAGRSRVFSLD